ncbi:MAG: hypothetical protein GEV11_15645 [Streptosporangiales bacterium]|nr:hypothetical protein [Streptosporangiales bacterium]
MALLLVFALAASAAVAVLTTPADADGSGPGEVSPVLRYGVLCLALAAGGAIASLRWLKPLISKAVKGQLSLWMLPFGLVAGVPLLVTVVAFTVSDVSWASTAWLGYAVVAPAFIIGLLNQQIGDRINMLVLGMEGTRHGQRPSDSVTWYLLILVADFYAHRPNWADARQIRLRRGHAVWVARRLERQSVLDSRTRLTEFRLRRQLRADYRKIAELVRLHGDAVVRVRTRDDYLRICESIRAGLLAATQQNWPALLEHAPEVTRFVRLGRLIRPAIGSLLLVGAGIAVGYLPGIEDQTALSARVALLLAAVLALIPGNAGASDTIRSTYDKALLWPRA